MAHVLEDKDVDTALEALDGWSRSGTAISRTITLPSFPRAIAFVSAVAEVAEDKNHHPDIDIRWRKVTFTCSTHSEGGITQLDLDLARTINDLAAEQD
ncbi:4a-hydroxytetrahydrobiopterin dehydratase [Hoyosella subflava]|uniref:Putative pterin-4-alpha-carbinolamine dehydratase n=1 Tax=Hoyosella subflava (strain DSM 45089 / JCM 17490 / NBRC 109087 / DQS3-9A1) TaxID=443218 RepID=F6EQ00_HOYSD|nr:4a-hydroxytetrahydrobiopterin dehydratase [Hoyosella subflava]AEF41821.1 Pterin-4-alpha-carbinolamine dehydratase [Hoyosella subflava DQS3-9A1]